MAMWMCLKTSDVVELGLLCSPNHALNTEHLVSST